MHGRHYMKCIGCSIAMHALMHGMIMYVFDVVLYHDEMNYHALLTMSL